MTWGRTTRRRWLAAVAGSSLLGLLPVGPTLAQEAFKVGLILPMTGPSASTGRQVEAAAKLYLAQKGDTAAGRKIELLVRDDTGVADTTKRLAQELVVREKVDVLAGFGLTPLASAVAPIATQAKKPMVIMAAATATTTEQSPFITRTSFTLPQATLGIARWAAESGMKKAVTLVTDYAPGLDAAKAFKQFFGEGGGQVVEELTIPLRNADFAPALQRTRDAKPDAIFVFVPSGQGAVFMSQFKERGLADAGIRLIGTGDVTDDDLLDQMGDAALGVVTAHHYSAAHDSPENKAFVQGFMAASNGMRPNFMAVAGYDGMHLIKAALEKAGAGADGTKLIEAMKGMSWTSPRGPMMIDPETRDVVQNIYLRRVERGPDGKLWNVEFATIPMVKDPVKAAKK